MITAIEASLFLQIPKNSYYIYHFVRDKLKLIHDEKKNRITTIKVAGCDITHLVAYKLFVLVTIFSLTILNDHHSHSIMEN